MQNEDEHYNHYYYNRTCKPQMDISNYLIAI